MKNSAVKKSKGKGDAFERFSKVALFVCILIIFHVLLAIASVFIGTPLGWAIAWGKGNYVIMTEHSGSDYRIERMGINYHGEYVVNISSPTCEDEYFTLWMDKWGNISTNNYDFRVGTRVNTGARLTEDYTEYLATKGLRAALPYETSAVTAEIVFYPADYDGVAYIRHKDALVAEEIELNIEPDMDEFGKVYGEISVYTAVEEPTYDLLAEMLLQFKQTADEKGVAFYTVNMSLQDEEGETIAKVRHFRYEDICEENLAERAKANSDAYDKRLDEVGLGEYY